jgi:Rps23 Pro-64 3,4-dihydroxylase Tpa1-like proline 4-hydroxylase
MSRPRLLDLNPALDVPALAAAFARDRRLQIRDVLTDASARTVHRILSEETPWGLGWQADAKGPRAMRHAEVAAMSPAQHEALARSTMDAMRGREYAFRYGRYPMAEAYGRWDPDGPHDMLLEYLNDRPVMELIRRISGIPELKKVDAQATLFGPSMFLAVHDDKHSGEGRRVAYVLNLCAEDWRPDWGGYLQFYDDAGDVVAGFRPRWNALNLFLVPQRHAVTYVAPFAPVARYAITGWFLDR